ncbi:hypothetical protein AJ87_07105 [Rhizobium yanglingense]|nr:hypothetical protein AJ87_07105 [Rhizobium yanglingense]
MTVAIYYYSYEFADILAPGANAIAKDIASNLLKVMALSTPFYVLSGMLSYLEAAYGKFGAIAWRPMILNIGSVAGAAMAVYLKADHWLATTLVISHIVLFLRTAFEIRGLDRLTPQGRAIWREAGKISARFLGNMVPLLGLPLIGQANLVVERIVSSWLGTHIIQASTMPRPSSILEPSFLPFPLVSSQWQRTAARPAKRRGPIRDGPLDF